MAILSSPLKASVVLALLAAGGAQAQVAIDQAAVLAGGVSAGDAPGFPVTLSVPGHYVLTSNLVAPANVGGISITAPNVTLSLNGFSIVGPVVAKRRLAVPRAPTRTPTRPAASAPRRMA